jgi:ribosome recycling factor
LLLPVRVSFPELTAERRTMLVKLAKERLEESRVALRSERDKVWKEIQEKEKAAELSEDAKFRAKEQMEKLVTEANDALEERYEQKEKNILE